MHRNTTIITADASRTIRLESRKIDPKMNITKTKVMVVETTPLNVNNVLIENEKATHTWDNTTASRTRTRTNIYDEESYQAWRHTPNTGISSKATLASA